MSNSEAPRFPLIDPRTAVTHLVRRWRSENHAFAAREVCVAKDDKSNKFVQLGSATEVLAYLDSKEVKSSENKPSIEDGFAIGFKGEPGTEIVKNHDDTRAKLQQLREGFENGREIIYGPYIKPTLPGRPAPSRRIDEAQTGVWVAPEVLGPDWTIVD